MNFILFYSKSESNIRVVRVKLNDGERVVGIRYPEILIKEVEKAMKEQQIWEKMHPNLLSQSQLQLSQAAILNGSLATGHMMNLSQSSQSTSAYFPSSQTPSSPIPFTNILGSQNNQSTITPQSSELDPNSGNQSVSAGDPNVAVSKSVIEEVTAVNPKTQAKALRPPVTIKNFFKPAVKNVSSGDSKLTNGLAGDSKLVNEKESSSGDQKSDNQRAVSADSETVIANRVTDSLLEKGNHEIEKECKPCGDNKGTKKVKKEMSYSEFLEMRSGSDAGIELTENGENHVTDYSESESKSAKKDTVSNSIVVLDQSSNDASPVKQSSTKRTEAGVSEKQSVGKKRKLEEKIVNRPAKKSKQTSLKSSFAKMESKSVTCPICAKVFEKGISNADLNQHIDNCIIE